MYAILIACSIVLKLNDDRSIWNSDIPNPNPIINGNYRSSIKNPQSATYEVVVPSATVKKSSGCTAVSARAP